MHTLLYLRYIRKSLALRILGPNCHGPIMCFFFLDFTHTFELGLKGDISFVSGFKIMLITLNFIRKKKSEGPYKYLHVYFRSHCRVVKVFDYK